MSVLIERKEIAKLVRYCLLKFFLAAFTPVDRHVSSVRRLDYILAMRDFYEAEPELGPEESSVFGNVSHQNDFHQGAVSFNIVRPCSTA